MKSFLTVFLVSLIWLGSALAAVEKKPGGEIPTGKWVGYLRPQGSPDAVALSMDSFLVKPDSIDESPRLTFLFRLGLGGYLSPEYETEMFQDVQYDGDQGLLTLDEPRNELRINAVVYSTPYSHMEGTVFFRSASISAELYLKYQTDEPNEGEGEGEGIEPPPFVPTLAGQYEGVCGSEKAVLQIETAKGLTSELPVPSTGLHHYLITGTMGVENGLCSVNPPGNSKGNSIARPNWCVDHSYTSASYDFVQGKLYLSGTLDTDECTRDRDTFICRMRFLPKDSENRSLAEETCRFRKVRQLIAPFVAYPRRYHVAATAEQKKPLPPVNPPASKELVLAARGVFHGYLHHDGTDRYQPLRLDVNATTSSDNPMHNPNNVFVSVSALFSFGREISGEYWAHQFDRQTLNIVAGYTLMSAESDTFLQITEWTQGFISGVWYSKAFGRVGTFEVAKDSKLPTLPLAAKTVAGIGGHFRGPETLDFWDLRLIVPRQPRFADKSYVFFQGNYQLVTGGVTWPIRKILRGSYDIYSGSVAWMENSPGGDAKLVTGFMDEQNLRLFWPSDRAFAISVFDHTWVSHGRTP